MNPVAADKNKKRSLSPLGIKFALLCAMGVPILARLNLHNTGAESQYARYIIPALLGCLIGYLLGQAREQFCRQTANLAAGNTNLLGEIQERKRAEKELAALYDRNELILQAAGEGIYGVAPDGRTTFVNAATLRLTEYSEEELIGQQQHDLIHHTKADGSPYPREECPIFNTLRTGVEYHSTNEFFWRKDGSRFPVEYFSAPIRQDGTIVGGVVIFNDITKRRHAENALHESEERFRVMAGNINEVFWLTTPESEKILYISPAYETLWQQDREALYRNPQQWTESIHPDDLDLVRASWKKQQQGEATVTEFRIQRPDGSSRWIANRAYPITNERGKVERITGIAEDITEKKTATEGKERYEMLLHRTQRMEALGTLSGGIAHDFNNILMGIQGLTSLSLFDINASNPLYAHLKGIENYIKSASDLTGQLLGLAKGSAFEVRPIRLNDVILKQNEMFRRMKKEIHLREELEPDIWTVKADQGQIEQVLMNLYINAWHAMPNGGDLTVTTRNVVIDEMIMADYRFAAGNYIKITVTDNGIGMDRETQTKIFDPFFTTREKKKGTGLGLTSTYGIIKNHKGYINVYSEKGYGTTFSIYLPASDTDQETAPPDAQPTEITKGCETILLVDDEAIILGVGKEMLEVLGYAVLTAGSGAEAVALYQAQPEQIDLVILDMVMPDMGGGETYDALTAITADIRVLLASGYSLNGQASVIMERGCNGFIQKPFDLNELSRKVREIIDRDATVSPE